MEDMELRIHTAGDFRNAAVQTRLVRSRHLVLVWLVCRVCAEFEVRFDTFEVVLKGQWGAFGSHLEPHFGSFLCSFSVNFRYFFRSKK